MSKEKKSKRGITEEINIEIVRRILPRVCASCNGSVFGSFEGMYCPHLYVNLGIQVDVLVTRKKKY
jgi:hypothetical protein